MSFIADHDIELMIFECVEKLIEETDLALTLTSDKEDGFEIVFEDDKWKADRKLDPLSCVLYFKKPLPYKEADDNIAVSTLVKLFDKSVGWVRSFNDAIRGQPNNSSSIRGFAMGRQIRQKITNKMADRKDDTDDI